MDKGNDRLIVLFDVAPAQLAVEVHPGRRRPGCSHLLRARARLESAHAVIFLLFVNDFCAEIVVFNLLLFEFVILIFGQVLLGNLEVGLLVIIKVLVEARIFFECPVFGHVLILLIDCVNRDCEFRLAGLLS